MATITNPQYPFDPSGQASTNRVVGELQPLIGGNDGDYSFIIPAATPFFGDSMSLNFKSLQGDVRPLVIGIDFYLSHYFLGASRACLKPIYGSITILNKELRGTLILNPYQTLGGIWTVDAAKIAEILADQAHNPRTTTWDQVVGYPEIFPPIPHEWNLKDLVGMSQVTANLDKIADAILTQATSAMVQHINNKSENVHGVTAAMIGAMTKDDVMNLLEETISEFARTTDDVREGDTNKYFTESRVLSTKLTDFGPSSAEPLDQNDNVLGAMMKLQATNNAVDQRLNRKVNGNRPAFTGLGSQNLVEIPMTATVSIDITQAEAYRLLVQGNGAIGFDTSKLGDMTGQVIEFSVTTVNAPGTTEYAIAWPENVDWVDGQPPPRTTTPGARDAWYFWSEDGGVTWTGSLSNLNPR